MKSENLLDTPTDDYCNAGSSCAAHTKIIPVVATKPQATPTSGWSAVRPSSTENIYMIQAESFMSAEHLQRLLQEAQAIANEGVSPAHPP